MSERKPTSLCSRIVGLRKEHGLSLSRLADLAGISKSSLHEIEHNPDARPSAATLYDLAEVLGTSIGYLLGREAESAPEPRVEEFPPALLAFAGKARIPLADTRGLAVVQYRGKQPKTVADWAFLYEALKRCCDEVPK